METKMTSAEKFCQVAEWLKAQDEEFNKNFKNSRGIYNVYNALPSDYDKSTKITDYIEKNKKALNVKALAKIICKEFDFKYFDFVPNRYTITFGLRTYKDGSNEVWMKPHDNWDAKARDMVSGVDIKDLGNARRACEKLLNEHVEYHGDSYDCTYLEHLSNAMKTHATCDDEDMSVGLYV